MGSVPEFKFDIKLLEGSLICFIGGALCSGGGIGGGAFYLCTFILLLGMDTHTAVPLSKVTIFGIALGGLFVIVPQKHPLNKLRTLVDYNAVMILQPMVLLGTVVGVFMNVIFPNWLITIGLAILFCVTSYRTLSKGFKLRKKDKMAQKLAAEEEARKAQEALDASNLTESDGVSGIELNDTKRPANGNGDDDGVALIDDANEVPIVTDEHNAKKKETRESVIKALSMIVVMIGMFVFLYLKGSTSGKSAAGIECGSPVYWGLVAAVFPYMICVTLFVLWFLKRHKRRIVLEGDLTLSKKQMLQIVFGGFFAGLLSSFLGVGGGVVVGPLLLELGLLPQVATATSSFMIVNMAMLIVVSCCCFSEQTFILNYSSFHFLNLLTF